MEQHYIIYKELSVISFLATQGVVVFLVFICDIISEEIENKTVEDLIAGNLSSNNRKASLIERKLGQFKVICEGLFYRTQGRFKLD